MEAERLRNLLHDLAGTAFNMRWDLYAGLPEITWGKFCAAYDRVKAALPRDGRAHFLLHVLGTRAYALRFNPSQEAWRKYCEIHDALREEVEEWIRKLSSSRTG